MQIGIPEETVLSVSPSKMTVSHADISAVLPKRSTVSHKGDFGRVLCICGSRNMPGAAVLAVTGAVRAGAGLVTAAFPGGAYNAIAPHLTEPLLLPLGGEAESFALKDFAALKPAIKNADCILIGCGIGQSPETRELVYAVIRGAQCPVVIDADGINAVARNINILKEAKAGVILTPHPGEMSRLTGLSAEAILNDTCAAAEKFAKETGAVIALKTANTAVANGSGCVYVNRGGNDGMAKGGSGDLLAGMTASLAAQGMKLFDAATAAVYIHSEAGDRAAKKLSRRGMTPSDMARELPMLLSEFE